MMKAVKTRVAIWLANVVHLAPPMLHTMLPRTEKISTW